jgi:nucleoid-associated protein YgaU
MMTRRKTVPLFILAVLSAQTVFTQEAASISAGVEANLFTQKGWAAGPAITVETRFSPAFSAGVEAEAAFSSDSMTSLLVAPYLRLYFTRNDPEAEKRKFVEIFAQAGAGLSLMYDDTAASRGFPAAVFSAGARLHVSPNWYIEPYLKGGYPFLGGAGIRIGRKFFSAATATAAATPAYASSPNADWSENADVVELERQRAELIEQTNALEQEITDLQDHINALMLADKTDTAATFAIAAHYPDIVIQFEYSKTHEVRWGDTLSKLAKQYYGSENGYYFPLIQLASQGKITNPDRIISGDVLIIPDIDRNRKNGANNARVKQFLNEVASYYRQKGDRSTERGLREAAERW